MVTNDEAELKLEFADDEELSEFTLELESDDAEELKLDTLLDVLLEEDERLKLETDETLEELELEIPVTTLDMDELELVDVLAEEVDSSWLDRELNDELLLESARDEVLDNEISTTDDWLFVTDELVVSDSLPPLAPQPERIKPKPIIM